MAMKQRHTHIDNAKQRTDPLLDAYSAMIGINIIRIHPTNPTQEVEQVLLLDHLPLHTYTEVDITLNTLLI
jgi:hypothetical protein